MKDEMELNRDGLETGNRVVRVSGIIKKRALSLSSFP